MKVKELKALLEGVDDNDNVVISDCECKILEIVSGGEMSYGGIELRSRQEFPDAWYRDGQEVRWINGSGIVTKDVEEEDDLEVVDEIFGDNEEHSFMLKFHDGHAEGEGLKLEYPKLSDLTDEMIEAIAEYCGDAITDSGYVTPRDVCLKFGKVVEYNAPMKNPLPALINDVDETFKKDDIHSAPREVLENLILRLYDGLNHANGTYPDWWDREN